jgi:integrase/recombinase XerD
MSPTTQSLVQLYLTALAGEGKADATLVEYRRELKRLVDMYPAKAPPDFSTLDIELFLSTRCAGRSLATRKKVLVVLSCFFSYLHDRGVIPTNPCKPIAKPRLPEPDPSYWDGKEIRAILHAPMQPRDHLLLETLARTGQRAGVVRTLKWEQVKLSVKEPRIDFGRSKGGRVHSIPLDQQLLHDMIVYKRLSNPEPGDWVFRSRKGGPLSPQQVNRTVAKACVLAGVRVASAHEFRRSCITNLLEAGVPFDVVSRDIANHKNPQTTMRHYRGTAGRRAIQALKGLPY